MCGEYANKTGVDAPKTAKIEGIIGVQHKALTNVPTSTPATVPLFDVCIFNFLAYKLIVIIILIITPNTNEKIICTGVINSMNIGFIVPFGSDGKRTR